MGKAPCPPNLAKLSAKIALFPNHVGVIAQMALFLSGVVVFLAKGKLPGRAVAIGAISPRKMAGTAIARRMSPALIRGLAPGRNSGMNGDTENLDRRVVILPSKSGCFVETT